jgi:hypothetical protein
MNGWRSWRDTPPQISGVPIWVRLGGLAWIDRIADVQWIGVVEGLEWAATGIYREEFWSVTGCWE